MGILAAILIVILFIITISSARTVRPVERGLIERFGKYDRFANPGLNFIIPFGIEKMVKVNITENMVNSEKREMITLDSLNCIIEAQIYFKVKSDEQSVKTATYGVNDYKVQIVALAKTTLRNIIGTMSLKDANSGRDRINGELYKNLSKETAGWGIEIVRTELKEVTPPKSVQDVMNEVVVASNKRVAALDFATATETEADGKKRAQIKNAEGIKQAKILEAEGEAQAIQLVNEAANRYFVDNAQVLRKIQAVEVAMKVGDKIVIPDGKSLINVVGSLAGIQ